MPGGNYKEFIWSAADRPSAGHNRNVAQSVELNPHMRDAQACSCDWCRFESCRSDSPGLARPRGTDVTRVPLGSLGRQTGLLLIIRRSRTISGDLLGTKLSLVERWKPRGNPQGAGSNPAVPIIAAGRDRHFSYERGNDGFSLLFGIHDDFPFWSYLSSGGARI